MIPFAFSLLLALLSALALITTHQRNKSVSLLEITGNFTNSLLILAAPGSSTEETRDGEAKE